MNTTIPLIDNNLSFFLNSSDPEGLPLNGVCRVHSRSQDHLSRPYSSAAAATAENRKFLGSPPPPAPHGAGSMYFQHSTLCPEVARALNGVMLIAEQKKRLEESTKVSPPVWSQFQQHFMSSFFMPIFYCLNTHPNCKHSRHCTKHFCMKKLLVKCWWNWHLLPWNQIYTIENRLESFTFTEILLWFSGDWGLEVRSHGLRSPFSLDIYGRGLGGHGRHHPPGPDSLRRPPAARCSALRDRTCNGPTHGRGQQRVKLKMLCFSGLPNRNKKRPNGNPGAFQCEPKIFK